MKYWHLWTDAEFCQDFVSSPVAQLSNHMSSFVQWIGPVFTLTWTASWMFERYIQTLFWLDWKWHWWVRMKFTKVSMESVFGYQFSWAGHANWSSKTSLIEVDWLTDVETSFDRSGWMMFEHLDVVFFSGERGKISDTEESRRHWCLQLSLFPLLLLKCNWSSNSPNWKGTSEPSTSFFGFKISNISAFGRIFCPQQKGG